MTRKKGCEHGQMLYSADGYVTAWFMWQLKNVQNPARMNIKGRICGIKVEEIGNPRMRDLRILDKLVDELAKGKFEYKTKYTAK